MKRLITILLIGVLLSSCKKGAEDPIFTVLPRKARLTGTWTLLSGTGSRVYTNTSDTHSNAFSESYSVDNFINSVTYVNGANEVNYQVDLDVRYEFNRDKTAKESWKTEVYNLSTGQKYVQNRVSEGTWGWKSGKEHVLLKFESVLTENDCVGCDTTLIEYSSPIEKNLKLIRLANRELKIEIVEEESGTSVSDITTWNIRLIKD